MGAVAEALQRSAEAFGAEVRTSARVERVLVEGGRAAGVALTSGEEVLAPLILTAVHPKITFLQQLERHELPDDFVRDIEGWNSRSGVVKINCALSRLPRFTAMPELTDLSGGVELAHSVEYLEAAFEQARRGEPAARPFSDGIIPTVYDRSLAPEGWTCPAGHMALIEEKIVHSSQRAAAHSKRGAAKVTRVFSEVLTGRYARYSNSWASVFEDLCF